jgi:hypothetical protein
LHTAPEDQVGRRQIEGVVGPSLRSTVGSWPRLRRGRATRTIEGRGCIWAANPKDRATAEVWASWGLAGSMGLIRAVIRGPRRFKVRVLRDRAVFASVLVEGGEIQRNDRQSVASTADEPT